MLTYITYIQHDQFKFLFHFTLHRFANCVQFFILHTLGRFGIDFSCSPLIIMPRNISMTDPIFFLGIFVMKSCNSMSLSFTMLLSMCLHIRTQAPLQIFMEFFIGEFTKIY